MGPCPGNSQNLNPNENFWAILKKRVDHQKPTKINELKTFLQQEWRSVILKQAKLLVYSMPKRIEEVLKKKGKHSKLIEYIFIYFLYNKLF